MYTHNPYLTHTQTASQSYHEDYTNRALQLYRRISLRGLLGKLFGMVMRNQSQLLDLNCYASSLQPRGQHYAGIKAVSLHQIRGTQGKDDDFDAGFAPLNERTRSRWLKIAIARMQGTPLPPVELIQVGDIFFVVDGHHRISVAKALGEQMIDAEIKVWNVNGPLPWEKNTSKPALSSQTA